VRGLNFIMCRFLIMLVRLVGGVSVLYLDYGECYVRVV